MPPMTARGPGVDEGARRSDGHETGEHAVGGHRRVGLAPELPHQEHRGDGAGRAGDKRVGDDDGEAEVARRQRRDAVEADPSEDQDDRTQDGHGDVVPGYGVRATVLVELAKPRSEDDGARQGREAADRVHHARAGEVQRTVAQTGVAAQRRQPPAAPDPTPVDGVGDGGHEHTEYDEGRELPPFGHGAGDDRGCGVHEHELEQEERHDGRRRTRRRPGRSPGARRCPIPWRSRACRSAAAHRPSAGDGADATELRRRSRPPSTPAAPIAKMTKLVMMTWLAFFARQKPVSTSAKPACMKKMSATPKITHVRLAAILRWPRSAAVSVRVACPAARPSHRRPCRSPCRSGRPRARDPSSARTRRPSRIDAS